LAADPGNPDSTAARMTDLLKIGTKVRFIEQFRPEGVPPGAVGVICVARSIWATSKSQGQIRRLHLAAAHARPVGGRGLTPLPLCAARSAVSASSTLTVHYRDPQRRFT
jgi:hypothetical protein